MDDLLARADALDRKIDDKTERVITDLVDYGKKNRRLIHIITAMVVFQFVIAGILTLAIVKIRDNSASIGDLCTATNVSNANETKLWNFVLNAPSTTEPSEQQKAVREQFKQLLIDTFPQVKCAQPKVVP